MSELYNAVKRDLLNVEYDDACLYAFLSGAIRGAGELGFTQKGFALCFLHNDKEFVEKLCLAVNRLTGETFTVERVYRDIKITQSVFYRLAVPSEYSVELLERCQIVRARCELVDRLPKSLLQNAECKRAYLDGLFLACGYLGVPDKIDDWHGGRSRCGYLLEFKLNSDIVKRPIKDLIEKCACAEDSVFFRKRGSGIYIKQADAVSRVLAAMGSVRGALSVQEIMAERQMKNDLNRINNFDLANLDKTLSASEKLCADIRKIDKYIGLETLPPSLAETASVRLEYPDDTLEELGMRFDPPLSKSCINHRLRRLSEIADGI